MAQPSLGEPGVCRQGCPNLRLKFGTCPDHGMSKRNERIRTTVNCCRKKLMAAWTRAAHMFFARLVLHRHQKRRHFLHG